MQDQPEEPPKFDPNFARDLLLEIAQERSLEGLLKKVIQRLMERPTVARMLLWKIEKGDICSACPKRTVCPDQTLCLHLLAGADRPLGASEVFEINLESEDARVPLGVGLVGRMASEGRQLHIRDLAAGNNGLFDADYVRREQIRGFNGAPIIYKGEVLGVVGVFSHAMVPDDAVIWIRILADFIAGAMINTRSFEEIQRLKSQLELENAYLQQEVVNARAFGDLIGKSPALMQTVSQIDMVAGTDASVLILGETGTGKELVAHEIHRRSKRKDKPLIRVNCASIPKELYESEFFGHAKGAFTGAIKDRAGRFETADGGTLFLDEIGEVPLDLQGKLLRVLQERTYERVGEDKTRSADVRIIAATNRDLKSEAAAGRFRQDLYYRLNVFPMQIAPLRDRQEDIPLLAAHFIELSVKEMRCPKPRLTRAGVAQLLNYNWPGNVRELRNVIERAVILARGAALEFDLPGGDTQSSSDTTQAGIDAAEGREFLTETEMRQCERDNLLAVLEKAGWKIKGPDGAAELLGVKPTTLISRIQKMGLQRPK